MPVEKGANALLVMGNPVRDSTWKASAAVTVGRFVRPSSATEVAEAGLAATDVIGFADRDLRKALTDTYAIGETVPVIYCGSGAVVVATAGGAITRGEVVRAGATGKVVAMAAAAVGDDRTVVGRALEAATADGDKLLVLLER